MFVHTHSLAHIKEYFISIDNIILQNCIDKCRKSATFQTWIKLVKSLKKKRFVAPWWCWKQIKSCTRTFMFREYIKEWKRKSSSMRLKSFGFDFIAAGGKAMYKFVRNAFLRLKNYVNFEKLESSRLNANNSTLKADKCTSTEMPHKSNTNDTFGFIALLPSFSICRFALECILSVV